MKEFQDRDRLWICGLINLLLTVSWTNHTAAQITPDATLPNPSNVINQGNQFTIEGGTSVGSNLFHSFQEFSLPTGTEAFFHNSLDIQNIFSRVTGKNISNIDGLIRANGSANLFLINPNGLIFGPNAKLNIGGSFLGTTAQSIIFQNGQEFRANHPNIPPLLTVNVPNGLQFGANPGDIQVGGNGYDLQVRIITFAPISGAGQSKQGLRVQPTRTLALLGGNLILNGGILTAPGGKIQLASVNNSLVNIEPDPNGWQFNYQAVQNWNDIQMSSHALADASGVGSGTVQVQTRNLALRDGSLILIQNQGSQPSGVLSINATESIDLSGTSQNANFGGGLRTETVTDGQSSDIFTLTKMLLIERGAAILSRTFSQGRSGNIAVNASLSTDITEPSPANLNLGSAISNNSLNSGIIGNTTIDTGKLRLVDSGAISSSVLGSGGGGTITVKATESIEIIGVTPNIGSYPSAISSSSFNSGNAGEVEISTPQLVARNGGVVASSGLSSGNAGNIAIDASLVDFSGNSRDFNSGANSSVLIASPQVRQAFRLPAQPTGNAGQVTINASVVRIANNAGVAVRNQGTGDAGQLSINANQIFLNTGGVITASTKIGNGGNIELQINDLLQLRSESQITAAAGEIGNGGNLTINANTIATLGNSNINANAFAGKGGNIQIITQGLFRASSSIITASSKFGVSGNININTPDVNPTAALIELPVELVDRSHQIVSSCARLSENTFTVSGRGGLIEDPATPFSSEEIWQDMTDYSSHFPSINATNSSRRLRVKNFPEMVEASSWQVNGRGEVVLVAVGANSISSFSSSSYCHSF